MCLKGGLGEHRVLPAGLMLWPLDFLVELLLALKMQEQILPPTLMSREIGFCGVVLLDMNRNLYEYI